MCGIAGILSSHSLGEDNLYHITNKMLSRLPHRGPDSQGAWYNDTFSLSLAHTRLAINDLSSQGAQPMISSDGRYVISFNGEIYNFLALRQLLSVPASLSGRSDTEVLLELISTYGIDFALKSIVGMFAFALWDKKHRTLTLCRDRIGEKPLYYGVLAEPNGPTNFVFSSELASLAEHPSFKPSLSSDATSLFLQHNYIPAPYTIYSGIYKLEPAHKLTISPTQFRASPEPYWSLHDVVRSPRLSSTDSCTDLLHNTLKEVISEQMVSDVPLGAFLSGGIDSSIVVSIMQSLSGRPVNTYSIGFSDVKYDESSYAESVASHLGTNHTSLTLSSTDAINLIPHLSSIYSEPFADSSQIPTFFVSHCAKQDLTVALSGDGGDEMFCGYNRYNSLSTFQKLLKVPYHLRLLSSSLITSLSPHTINRLLLPLLSALPPRFHHLNPGDKLHKIATILPLKTTSSFYTTLIQHWDPQILKLASSASILDLDRVKSIPDNLNYQEQMMFLDTLTYLPDDILTKVDRAAMANSLETRIPFLDQRIVELAWRIPHSLKYSNGVGKLILREILNQYVPTALTDRPKMGFGIPLDNWLRTELREWCTDLLSPDSLNSHGFFDTKVIQKILREHMSCQRNHQYLLWDILMFQSWFYSSPLAT